MIDEPRHPVSAIESDASRPDWPALPFDPATNFSLLGWILDKFNPGRKSEKKVDLWLEE